MAARKQISFADTEARIMGKKGSFDYAYNAQISVDADQQIIVGLHISQNANDKQELEPAFKALQDTSARLPDQLSADNGYFSGDNLQALEQSGIDAVFATDKGEKLTNRLWTGRSVTWSRPTLPTTKPITTSPALKDRF